MAQSKTPVKQEAQLKLIIKASTLDEEFSYLTGEILPRFALYQKAGYRPTVPTTKLFQKAARNGLNSIRSVA